MDLVPIIARIAEDTLLQKPGSLRQTAVRPRVPQELIYYLMGSTIAQIVALLAQHAQMGMMTVAKVAIQATILRAHGVGHIVLTLHSIRTHRPTCALLAT